MRKRKGEKRGGVCLKRVERKKKKNLFRKNLTLSKQSLENKQKNPNKNTNQKKKKKKTKQKQIKNKQKTKRKKKKEKRKKKKKKKKKKKLPHDEVTKRRRIGEKKKVDLTHATSSLLIFYYFQKKIFSSTKGREEKEEREVFCLLVLFGVGDVSWNERVFFVVVVVDCFFLSLLFMVFLFCFCGTLDAPHALFPSLLTLV